ncbi:hypothetical protein FSP39_020692 [Pinctada imbricata]|uniref:Uncharacterized protein n=1 Tax=Pinctada imbricata TaxID=66713 RepID=A0AA89C640_PINIB|nr:hypothetical protein FSP39_020692 [Pinctada imbricata]
MESQERLMLPPGPQCRNKRDTLTKLVTEWLSEIGLGFSKDAVETIGKNFIAVLTNTLWYIDPYVDQLNERSCYVPKQFDRFFGLNDPRLRKKKLMPVESSKLLDHATNIDVQLELPFMQTERWKAVQELLTDMSTAIHKYVKYLENQRVKMKEIHGLDHPRRSPSEAEKLLLIHPNTVVKPTFKARYKPLVDLISSAPYNDPLCIDDFTSDDTLARRYYLQNITVSIPMKAYMYSYAYGNNLGTYHFIWKVDPCLDENETLNNQKSLMRLKLSWLICTYTLKRMNAGLHLA